jgi:DNA-binding NtrC family response regulator
MSGNPPRRPRLSPPHADGLRLRDIERAAIEKTLEQTGNNQSKTARILGISRPTLLRKLKEYRDLDARKLRGDEHREGNNNGRSPRV